MLASVVIPTRNRPVYVAETVESLFDGDYSNFEIFVIDQSADNKTETALERFASDPRFKYLKNARDGVGASSSRNIGIALSSGEIVANIDDDVVARPEFLSTLVREFESDPALDFVAGKLTAPEYDRTKGIVPDFCPDESISAWRLPIVSAGANYCMRRSLFDRIGGYDECWGPGSRFGISDDGDICFRIVRSGAKWKACRDVEVVHVHGFRENSAANALMQAYDDGVGANFGRFMRRGDIRAGVWFLAREVRQTARATLKLVKERDGSEMRNVGLRLRGFRKGFLLPPNAGFVTGDELRSMRSEYEEVLNAAALRHGSGLERSGQGQTTGSR
jgi:glycosyltransferase involved in cell wall biosynthesis